MAFKNKSSMVRYYFFSLLDTLIFDQYMLFLSEFWYGFSYLALAWYSMLKRLQQALMLTYISPANQ